MSIEINENEGNDINSSCKRPFKGKIVSIWIHGYVVVDYKGITITTPGCDLSRILGICRSSINPFSPFSAMGFRIGLTDKNGNKIYTGDIFRTKKGGIYTVVYNKVLGYELVSIRTADETTDDFLKSDNIEIVGNIYD